MGIRETVLGIAAALLAAVALVGCDGGETRAAAASPQVDLRIAIAASARAGAPVRTWRLRCKPRGGDWPDTKSACARLTAQLLRPITAETRDLRRITAQPVRIRGEAFGETVSLRFGARGSGTRRARLRALRTALSSKAFAEAQRRSR